MKKIDVSRKDVMKIAKRLTQKAVKNAKAYATRLEKAQRKGSLSKWKNAIALGLAAVEVGMLASKVLQSGSRRALPARKAARRRAKA